MTAPSAPTREIGYAAEAGSTSYNWWMYDGETTPELRWPLSVQVYDQMRTQDAQIQSVLRAVTMPVRRTPWRIDPAGAREEVVRLVADDLGLPVVGESKPVLPPRTKDRFSWAEHLRLALLMLPFGFMYFEQVYRVSKDGSRAHLRKLGPRLPRTIEDIKVARDGGLLSILQYGTVDSGGPQRPIPVDRLVAYIHEREGGNWLGRALALDTPVPTPDGWQTMGDLRPGDRVFDETGQPCTVTAVRRWSDRPCYRLQFDDGEGIVADANHRWLSHVRVGQKREPRIVTTEDMAATVLKYGQVNHAVPLAGPLELPDVDLPVDPYVLGAWLGDGSTTGGSAYIVDAEGDVAAEIQRRGCEAARRPNWEKYRAWKLPGLYGGLRDLGIVSGTGRATRYASSKHVPAVYLRASARQRLDLLRGLMDTDGHFDMANGQCNFNNTNKALSMAVAELAASLGAKVRIQYVRQAGSVATMKSGAEIHSRKDIYRVKFTAQFLAFTMERKAKQQDLERAAKRPYHYVRSVEVEPNQDTVCIEVDSPSHLYLCGVGHKPTHNSILRSSYKNWLLKDRLLRVDAQTIERNGMGIPVYTGAEGETDLAAGKALATSLRAGETAGAAIPPGSTLELKGVSGDLPQALPSIEYHDSQIARGVLAHFLNLGTQTGSWALGTTFADFFTLSLQTLADQVADTATQHIVEDLVDVNWGEDEPAPKVVHDEIGSRQAATAQAVKLLVDAGIIQADEVLEESTRQQYGLPPKDPDTTREKDDGGFGGFGAPAEPSESAGFGQGSAVYASGDAGPKDDGVYIDDDDDDEPGQFDLTDDEAVEALVAAIAEFTGEVRAAGLDWNPALHPRDRKGRFRTVFARVMNALEQWSKGEGGDRPLKGQGFTRDNLRTVATKNLGLTVRRGAPADEIEDQILDHVRARVRVDRDAKVDAPKRQAKFTLQGGDPAKAREVEVENKIRAAYSAALARKSNQNNRWVGLAEIRDEIGESVNRHELDRVLLRMGTHDKGVTLVPEDVQSSLTQADRDSAIHVGGRQLHHIKIENPSPRPVPKSHRDLDVAVYRDKAGRPALYREDDSGKRGALVQKFDSLDEMARWADDNDEPRLAEWARKESGGKTPAKAVEPPRAVFSELRPASRKRLAELLTTVDKGEYPGRGPRDVEDLNALKSRGLIDEDASAPHGWRLTDKGREALSPAPAKAVAKKAPAKKAAPKADKVARDLEPGDRFLLPGQGVRRVLYVSPSGGGDVVIGYSDPDRPDMATNRDAMRVPGAEKFVVGSLPAPPAKAVAKKAPAKKAAPAAPARPRGRTKDLTRDHAAIEAAFDAGKEDGKWQPSGSGVGSQRGGRFDLSAGGYQAHLALAREQGFDGPPRVLSGPKADDEWGRLEDQGWKPLFRGWGWGSDLSGEDMADEFLYGDLHVGGGLGLGTNMSDDFDAANYYASHDRFTPIYGGRTAGFLLDPDAKIIRYPDAVKMRDAYLAKLPDDPKFDAEREVFEDPGTFAMARGYDAMVASPDEAGIVKQGTEEWVIFNRTKVVALDDNPHGAADFARRQSGAEGIRLLRETDRDGFTFANSGPGARGGEAQKRRTAGLDALVEKGYLRKDGSSYKITDAGREHLKGSTAPDLTGLTIRQKRARLKALGFTPEQIDELAPTATLGLAAKTIPQLRALAKQRGLTGYSKLTKPQLLALLGAVEAAAGRDITPGNDELHHYWTRGKGLAKWSTWTELVAHLTKHVGPLKARTFASRWFFERYGFYSGSDLNRVKHGKPPRGKLIGPG